MKQFKLSIPTEIKDWLADRAARNLRSQSAEIILALREKMERDAISPSDGQQSTPH
ncbi:Arc-like DNA binding dprotein [Agrobacterium vitis]|nr:Arc-like DNA binding dprotein [Agrobacterium vitis]